MGSFSVTNSEYPLKEFEDGEWSKTVHLDPKQTYITLPKSALQVLLCSGLSGKRASGNWGSDPGTLDHEAYIPKPYLLTPITDNIMGYKVLACGEVIVVSQIRAALCTSLGCAETKIDSLGWSQRTWNLK